MSTPVVIFFVYCYLCVGLGRLEQVILLRERGNSTLQFLDKCGPISQSFLGVVLVLLWPLVEVFVLVTFPLRAWEALLEVRKEISE